MLHIENAIVRMMVVFAFALNVLRVTMMACFSRSSGSMLRILSKKPSASALNFG